MALYYNKYNIQSALATTNPALLPESICQGIEAHIKA